MAKPLVGILLNDTIFSRISRPDDMKRLRTFARVRCPRPDKLTDEASRHIVKGCDALVTGWGSPALDTELLDLAPHLRIAAHSAGSVKCFVTEELWRRKIVVTTASPAIAVSVAEFTLGQLIMGLNRMLELGDEVSAGGWSDNVNDQRPVRGLYHTAIGIVGAGFIGRRLIDLLRPFDVEVLLYDPHVTEREAARLGVTKVGLERLARRSHAVTLHAPSIEATRHMIAREFLETMREDAVLVNTARGSLVDEAALAAVLKNRPRMLACLDVFDPEPPAPDHPLRALPNALLTPHIAGKAGFRRQMGYAVEELERFFNGRRQKYRVTKEKLKRMA